MSAVKNVIKDNYNMMLLKDYLRDAIKDAGFSHAEISKTPTGTRVALHVTRPGIVIGRKGSGIRDLTDKLAVDFGLKSPQISVVEIEKPELAPSVMCNRMASHLERGTAFRRATMWTLKQIMEGGAMGVQITISGKLRGDRSAFEKHTAGILPRAGHHAEVIVDEDIAHVGTAMGLIGIRIRIARKEKVVPEFEMKKESPKNDDKPKKGKQDDKPKKGKQDDKPKKGKQDDKPKKGKQDDKPKKKVEEIKVDDVNVEVIKVEGKNDDAKSESEVIEKEEAKIESIDTMEEEEANMK
jgi:small subunit ribosomal protein S3